MYVNKHTHARARARTHTHTHTYVFVCVCARVCVFVCVYIHTYIHTYTFFPFASNENLTDNLKYSGATCYPYEIIKTKKENGEINYPILSNMSVIAGEHAFIEADLFVSNTLATH